jgi:two-component system cell cycle sensor histidine kinase/response regulator CckA
MDEPLDLPTGTGCVLLVDDDADVRATIRLMLEILGYDVREAEDGPAALAAVRGGLEPDAVVLDLEMPQMRGDGVLRALHAIRPGLPVIVCSGYGRESLEGLEVSGYLNKPFTVQEVGRSVAAAIRGARVQ